MTYLLLSGMITEKPGGNPDELQEQKVKITVQKEIYLLSHQELFSFSLHEFGG